MSEKAHAYAAASVTVLLWSMSYLWTDQLLRMGIPGEFFIPLRTFLAGCMLWVLGKCSHWPMGIQRGDWGMFLLLSLCMPGIYFIAETYGILFTESPTISALVIASNPVFSTVVGMVLFKERMGVVNFVGLMVTVISLWLVTYSQPATGPRFLMGVGCLLLAVAAEVTQIACTKVLTRKYPSAAVVMHQFLLGTVFFLPFFLTKGMENFSAPLFLGFKSMGNILTLSLLCSATAFTLWAYAIKRLGIARISVFLAIIPLVTSVLSLVLTKERMNPVQWSGLITAAAGIFLSQWNVHD